MKMPKKKFVIVAVVTIFIVAIGMYPVISKTNSKNKKSNTITIYALEYQGHIEKNLQAIIDAFKAKYPNIKINEVTFDGSSEYLMYNQKILSDTLAGSGPDIIYVDPNFVNVKTIQKSGLFYDLNKSIKKDSSFKKEEYNEKLLDAGLYKGELTYIPLDYYTMGYITTKELLNNNKVNINSNMNENDFVKALSGYIASNKGNSQKTLFASQVGIGNFIASSGFKCVDYENKKTYFDKPEFKDIIDNYKKIYNASPKADDYTATSGSGEEGMDGIKNGTTLLSNDSAYTYGIDMLESESIIKGLTGESEVINSFPTYNGDNKTIAIAADIIGISNNASNKEAAFNFIKVALSEKIQSSISLQGIPINKEAEAYLKNKYMTEEVGKSEQISSNTNITMEKPSAELNNYYDKITNRVDEAVTLDTNVDKLIMDCMKPYFENQMSYATALKNLENKVNIYIRE